MNEPIRTIVLTLAILGAPSGAFAQDSVPPPIHHSRPDPSQDLMRPGSPRLLQLPPPEQPTATTSATNAGFATTSAFNAGISPSATSGSTLTAPISITYSGGSPALFLTDSGTNNGIDSVITNSHNASSALYGSTNGQGAGLTAYNTGTVGPAGKFYVTNAASAQPGVFATTSGVGPAVLGVVSASNTNNEESAILGQNGLDEFIAYSGIGVQGAGNNYGVVGFTSGGVGVTGAGGDGYGVEAYSDSGTALYAFTLGSGDGIVVHSYGGTGIYASSDTEQGVFGQSHNSYGVVGEDSGNGVGVYGSSAAGYAGYFNGKVGAISYVTQSDKNSKTDFEPIDAKGILDRVNRLPITSWGFKTDLSKRHVGPMAQDFHAAFGLDGDDDKHINLTDMAGISLAAIQELSKQLSEKDERIAKLEAENREFSRDLADMRAALVDLKSSAQRLAKN